MRKRTQEDLVWARTGKRNINVVRWSHGQGRVVSSQQKAHRAMAAWKEWKLRQGYEVKGSQGSGFFAFKDGIAREACALRIYDPKTLTVVS
jgi:hypothetical protein